MDSALEYKVIRGLSFVVGFLSKKLFIRPKRLQIEKRKIYSHTGTREMFFIDNCVRRTLSLLYMASYTASVM